MKHAAHKKWADAPRISILAMIHAFGNISVCPRIAGLAAHLSPSHRSIAALRPAGHHAFRALVCSGCGRWTESLSKQDSTSVPAGYRVSIALCWFCRLHASNPQLLEPRGGGGEGSKKESGESCVVPWDLVNVRLCLSQSAPVVIWLAG
jgi:hypothetical protein